MRRCNPLLKDKQSAAVENWNLYGRERVEEALRLLFLFLHVLKALSQICI